MVVVPAGSFMMGSTEAEREWAVSQGALEWVDYEKPQHPVDIAQPFAVGKYEVTRGQFAAFVEATGRKTSDDCLEYTGEWKEDGSTSWRSPGFRQTDRDPVVCVGWDDAEAYVAWLSERSGHQYRLPSEAEWEFAARAKTSTMRPWGDDRDNKAGCTYANGADLTAKEKFSKWRTMDCHDGQVYTAPVGSYSANGFGLHDMIGNASEWVEDCWKESYEGGAPKNGSAWTSGDCGLRRVRGGSWGGGPELLRAACRFMEPAAGYRHNTVGFRVARTFTP
jgi:formylglycine-generating enzyme required for sulfatase activity